MPKPVSQWTRRRALAALPLLAVGLANPMLCAADDRLTRRTRAGARLFRALLAADLGLNDRTAADGHLDVLVYARDQKFGEEIAALIAPKDKGEAIRGAKLRISVDAELPGTTPDGIFIASPLDNEQLQSWIAFCRRARAILYSPFEGDVERGVMAGLSIEATVQPYLNEQALGEAQIKLKPFFLRVAKVFR
jgi:hypothetical protein